ncbi:hypothetical protein D3C78_1804170 [compost metagenome]
MRVRLTFISCNARINPAVSSRPAMVKRDCKSPAATVRAMFTACASGRVMLRISHQVTSSPAASVSVMASNSSHFVC